ncbi:MULTISPECIES: hypothetical protein [Brevibacterium]|nr:hypothetical protein [Brevibacterium sandarakinum]
MNQVEICFSIRQRKAISPADFVDINNFIRKLDTSDLAQAA